MSSTSVEAGVLNRSLPQASAFCVEALPPKGLAPLSGSAALRSPMMINELFNAID